MEKAKMTRHEKITPAPTDPHANCNSVASVLDRIGDKWSVMVVVLLSAGTMRFNEIQRRIGGVSHRMLTLTLRGLERDGLVTRTVHPTVPPKVEYGLTRTGCSLIGPLQTLSDWAMENRHTVEKSRRDYDARMADEGGPRKPVRQRA
jgi:DNA-binding HxlR family transcriptional regulator